jgi:hypothetical protein
MRNTTSPRPYCPLFAWITLAICSTGIDAQETKPGAGDLVAEHVVRVQRAPVEEAWPSIAALRTAAADTQLKSRLKKAVPLLAEIAQKDKDPKRRGVAILCLGSTGRQGSGAVKPLVAILKERPLSELQLIAAVALSQLGKPAAKILNDVLALGPPKKKPRWTPTLKGKKLKPLVLKNASRTTALLAMFAVVHLGEDGRALSRRMIEHLQNHAGFDSYILYPHCEAALTAMGKARGAAAVIKKRHELEESTRRGGMLLGDPDFIRLTIEQDMGVKSAFPKLVYSLPDRYPVCSKRNTAGAMLLDLAAHVVQSLGKLREDLLKSGTMDYERWHATLEPLVGTAIVFEFLDSQGK